MKICGGKDTVLNIAVVSVKLRIGQIGSVYPSHTRKINMPLIIRLTVIYGIHLLSGLSQKK